LSSSPVPDRPLLYLRRGEDRRLRAGHLWIFSNEVDVERSSLSSVDSLVTVVDDRGQALGIAYYNPNTLIAARLLSRDARASIDVAWMVSRLRAALALRESLGRFPYYRWVFGESDGLPGLILDRYGRGVVGQIATLGMQGLQNLVERAIAEVLELDWMVWKNDSSARKLEGLASEQTLAFGAWPQTLQVIETLSDDRLLHFEIPWEQAQKTGWFYDQAFNRRLLAQFMPAQARALDVCCYGGGWSAFAAAAGASAVTAIDASAAALSMAQANFARNAPVWSTRAIESRWLKGDAVRQLAQLEAAGERFELVVVDPPAFIKRRKDLPQGRAAYRKLNQAALRLISSTGLLVSCSCSYHLTEADLLSVLQSAARQSGKFLQVLHLGSQGPDHPVHPALPETRYLKAIFCRVTTAEG
jgi:23S rRNA (cytosine1962-C5)-methyltransferase